MASVGSIEMGLLFSMFIRKKFFVKSINVCYFPDIWKLFNYEIKKFKNFIQIELY